MMLDRYKQRQRELFDVLDAFQQLVETRQDQHVLTNLRDITIKLTENQFYLVVLGQFKRGKSTFINSLLGTALLPTAIVPLTSIVTLIRYGATERIDVQFQNAERREVSRAELVEYVTEKGNPGNVKNVTQVAIWYPSDYLKDGVHIIDTPGVGSIFADNTRVTQDFLPQVDAALFLLAGDPPISQAELDFLKHVKQHVAKIFFIQNKVDLLDAADCQEALEFSQRVIAETLENSDIRIYPLSAKRALEAKLTGNADLLAHSRLPEFDRQLGDFLLREKGTVFLHSVLQSSRKLLADEKFAIDLEQKAGEMPLRDLEQKIQVFEQRLGEIQAQKDDNEYLYEGEIKRLQDLLTRDLDKLHHETLPRLVDELKLAGERHRDVSVEEYGRILEKILEEGIVQTFNAWVTREEERLNAEYARISQQFSARANAIIDDILATSAKLFDLPLERVQATETLNEESRLYYLMGDQIRFFDLEGAFDFMARHLIPKRLSQQWIMRKLLDKLSYAIDGNCGRVRSDFAYRIQQSFLKFRWNLNETIAATIKSVQYDVSLPMVIIFSVVIQLAALPLLWLVRRAPSSQPQQEV